jgi:UDP-N-acetylmuramate dehydrogenase
MTAGANGRETADTLVSVDFVDKTGQWAVLEKSQLQFHYRHSAFHQCSGAIVGALFALSPDPKARDSQLTIINYRKQTQPYHEPSAGCAFRNPDRSLSPLSAGALIEKAGLKGLRVGGARVSEMHANFIVNSAGASASDVIRLMQIIQQRVRDFAQVTLLPEIRQIPYSEEL